MYVDNITNQLYFYDGTSYQLLVTSGNVENIISPTSTIDTSMFLTSESDPVGVLLLAITSRTRTAPANLPTSGLAAAAGRIPVY